MKRILTVLATMFSVVLLASAASAQAIPTSPSSSSYSSVPAPFIGKPEVELDGNTFRNISDNWEIQFHDDSWKGWVTDSILRMRGETVTGPTIAVYTPRSDGRPITFDQCIPSGEAIVPIKDSDGNPLMEKTDNYGWVVYMTGATVNFVGCRQDPNTKTVVRIDYAFDFASNQNHTYDDQVKAFNEFGLPEINYIWSTLKVDGKSVAN